MIKGLSIIIIYYSFLLTFCYCRCKIWLSKQPSFAFNKYQECPPSKHRIDTDTRLNFLPSILASWLSLHPSFLVLLVFDFYFYYKCIAHSICSLFGARFSLRKNNIDKWSYVNHLITNRNAPVVRILRWAAS